MLMLCLVRFFSQSRILGVNMTSNVCNQGVTHRCFSSPGFSPIALARLQSLVISIDDSPWNFDELGVLGKMSEWESDCEDNGRRVRRSWSISDAHIMPPIKGRTKSNVFADCGEPLLALTKCLISGKGSGSALLAAGV
jgi:hypothetical protein